MSTFDSQRAEAFVGRILQTLNNGALCLMISIGHRTGLFDAMRGAPASTSAEIATRAGLNERYVREWLGAMTTGGVVDVDESDDGVDLHAPLYTRSTCDAPGTRCSGAP